MFRQKIYIVIYIYITKMIDKFKKEVLHFPRLDTVLMVEEFIKSHDGEFKKKKLWQTLPKKMMYQTFQVILNYLIHSRKISIDSEGKIGWIYYPETAMKYHSKNGLGRLK